MLGGDEEGAEDWLWQSEPCVCPWAPVSAVLVCLVCVILTPPFPCPRPRTALCLHCSPPPSLSFLQWLLPLAISPLPYPLLISVPLLHPPPPRPRLVSLHWTRLADGLILFAQSVRHLPPPPGTSSCPSPQPQPLRLEIRTRGMVAVRGDL